MGLVEVVEEPGEYSDQDDSENQLEEAEEPDGEFFKSAHRHFFEVWGLM